MVVISAPWKLKFAAIALYASIPLVGLQVAVAHRVPWWNLPYKQMAYWSLSYLLICIPLSVWILNARKWVLPLVSGLFWMWVLASAYESFRLEYPPLGFFAIFVSAFCLLEFKWIRRELCRSFIDPELSWYQGLPKPIPGLKCQLITSSGVADLRVSRIDQFGAFLFHSGSNSPGLPGQKGKRKNLELKFEFRNRQIACQGSAVTSVGDGKGLGIEFQGVSWDLKKEIGDFVEMLRGEGYV